MLRFWTEEGRKVVLVGRTFIPPGERGDLPLPLDREGYAWTAGFKGWGRPGLTGQGSSPAKAVSDLLTNAIVSEAVVVRYERGFNSGVEAEAQGPLGEYLPWPWTEEIA